MEGVAYLGLTDRVTTGDAAEALRVPVNSHADRILQVY